jgi:hypothetical protein
VYELYSIYNEQEVRQSRTQAEVDEKELLVLRGGRLAHQKVLRLRVTVNVSVNVSL